MEAEAMPTIFLYSVPAEQHRKLEALGMHLGYSCKKIARKRFLQPIGCHAGLPGFEQTGDWYEGKELPDPMILFSEFSDGLLNRFLAACKEDGMPQINYRAVVTEHNIHWNVLDLYQELVQEHESLHGGKVTL